MSEILIQAGITFEAFSNTYFMFSVLFVLSVGLFGWTLLRALLGLNVAKRVQRRMNQLNALDQKVLDNDAQARQLIDAVSDPAIKYLFPRIKMKDSWEKNRDLKLLGWDKYFTAEKYTATNLTLKIVAVVTFLLLASFNLMIATLWALVLGFIMDLFYFTQIDEKKNQLLMEFPDFIEVLEGYLSAGYDFVRATEAAIPVTKHWQPLLKEFAAIAQYENLETGFKYLYDMVDIFEVREFISILQLGVEQGLDMAENISHQTARIEELQSLAFTKKIANRQVMAVLVQGPLLLTVLVAFSLPTVTQMFSLNSM